MQTLIIYAHPEPTSLNGRLKSKSEEVLRQAGHTIEVSDLYAMRFSALAGPEDFTARLDPGFFDLQKEQAHAAVHGTFVPVIREEQAKLRRAELVVFHFPFWWYSMPAAIKGYFDRVFSVGFAYGGAKELEGKKVLVCTTTGAPDSWLSDGQPPGSVQRIFHHILFGTFAFCGMEVLEPFVVYRAKKLSDEEKEMRLEEWGELLRLYEQRSVLF